MLHSLGRTTAPRVGQRFASGKAPFIRLHPGKTAQDQELHAAQVGRLASKFRGLPPSVVPAELSSSIADVSDLPPAQAELPDGGVRVSSTVGNTYALLEGLFHKKGLVPVYLRRHTGTASDLQSSLAELKSWTVVPEAVEEALCEPLNAAGYPEHYAKWRVGINQDPLQYDADGRLNFDEINKWFALTAEETTNLQGLKRDSDEEDGFLSRLNAGTDSIIGEVDWAKAYSSVADREHVEVAKAAVNSWNGYKIDSAAYSAVSSHYNKQFANFELDAAFDRLAELKRNAYARLAETYVVAREASGNAVTRDGQFDLKPAVSTNWTSWNGTTHGSVTTSRLRQTWRTRSFASLRHLRPAGLPSSPAETTPLCPGLCPPILQSMRSSTTRNTRHPW